MQKQKPASNLLPGRGELIPGVRKDTGRQSKRTKMTPIRSRAPRLLTGTRKRLSPTIRYFPLISFRPKPPTIKNIKENGKREVT